MKVNGLEAKKHKHHNNTHPNNTHGDNPKNNSGKFPE